MCLAVNLQNRGCNNPSEYSDRGACLDPVKVTFMDHNRKQETTIEGIAIVMELATGGDLEHLLRK